MKVHLLYLDCVLEGIYSDKNKKIADEKLANEFDKLHKESRDYAKEDSWIDTHIVVDVIK